MDRKLAIAETDTDPPLRVANGVQERDPGINPPVLGDTDEERPGGADAADQMGSPRGIVGTFGMAGAGILGASTTPATAQQVKYSSGIEPPKLKVPANACDCHHHIYGSQYKVDPRSTLRPADATVDDYRAHIRSPDCSRDYRGIRG